MKETIDSQIAKEQARQRNPPALPSRSNSVARKATESRPASPAVRTARSRIAETLPDEAPKNTDPSEFDPEFVIDDDDSMSRSGTLTEGGKGISQVRTPSPSRNGKEKEGTVDNVSGQEPVAEKPLPSDKGDDEQGLAATPELPTDVRVRLRKLERLESRYQGTMLQNLLAR